MYVLVCIFCFHRANWHSSATLTEDFLRFFLRAGWPHGQSGWVQKIWLSPEIDPQTVQSVTSNYVFRLRHHADNFITDFLVQIFLEGFIIQITTKYTACVR